MASLTTLVPLLLSLSLSPLLVTVNGQAQGLSYCGDAPYFPSEYTCYDGAKLCPISYGIPTLPCAADGACYHAGMYECGRNGLQLLPEASAPFTLTVQGALPRLQNQAVRACGNYLAFGAGARECTFCVNAPPQYDCKTYANHTVFLGNGEMAADVPGSQYWFVSPTDGVLKFTEGGKANNASEISLAGKGVTVYQNGFFTYDGSPFWVGCLRTLPGGTVGTTRSYRIYAPTPENLAKTNCDQIKLVASAVASRKEGTYLYQ
ncbi:hypothetical protein B0H66DRAFT_607568 [Apodospora peruviana]|uniref:Endo-1,3(4)-beta-glucanase 1 carbohydrate binding domain-containing protein n=1 Tax=Apodospora peruviana TaxID=516989 RepID=A0AAE0M0A1_9PEZI|nr:hypothetical protein B0H66DRAFT_607568 [Apodospora peruviana]